MGIPNVAFSHMGINTFDADRMAAFYKRLLGMVETDRGKLGEDREIIFLSRAATDHHQVVMVSGRTAAETNSLKTTTTKIEMIMIPTSLQANRLIEE